MKFLPLKCQLIYSIPQYPVLFVFFLFSIAFSFGLFIEYFFPQRTTGINNVPEIKDLGICIYSSLCFITEL